MNDSNFCILEFTNIEAAAMEGSTDALKLLGDLMKP